MNTNQIAQTLNTLYAELIEGAPTDGTAYMLNGGDPGLLKSLDKISASAASKSHGGGASIAAHVDHLRYGLSLMNRWAAGERNPWKDADWTLSWRTTSVNDEEWKQLRVALCSEAERWLLAVEQPRDVSTIELNGVIGNIAHLAYHLGAIRQIDRTTRGPSAEGQ
jgi:hypothetical protein